MAKKISARPGGRGTKKRGRPAPRPAPAPLPDARMRARRQHEKGQRATIEPAPLLQAGKEIEPAPSRRDHAFSRLRPRRGEAWEVGAHVAREALSRAPIQRTRGRRRTPEEVTEVRGAAEERGVVQASALPCFRDRRARPL